MCTLTSSPLIVKWIGYLSPLRVIPLSFLQPLVMLNMGFIRVSGWRQRTQYPFHPVTRARQRWQWCWIPSDQGPLSLLIPIVCRCQYIMSLSFIPFVAAGFYWGSFGNRHNILPNRKSINRRLADHGCRASCHSTNNYAKSAVVGSFQFSVVFVTWRWCESHHWGQGWG